jgi:hypothetical protein
MKWVDAVNTWNKGKDIQSDKHVFAIPYRGTQEYDEVRGIFEGKKIATPTAGAKKKATAGTGTKKAAGTKKKASSGKKKVGKGIAASPFPFMVKVQ